MGHRKRSVRKLFRFRFFLILLSLGLLWSIRATAVEITSIAPSVASPGTSVTLTGGPFEEGATIIIGEDSVIPEQMERRKLIFTVPELPEGQYAVSLRQEGKRSPSGFTFHIRAEEPRIELIIPSEIDTCSSPEKRTVSIRGDHFKPGAVAFLDGAAISSSQPAGGEITFVAPSLEEGVHKVEVSNPDGIRSLPHTLSVNGVPEIFSVLQGEDEVVSYELIIHGKNFLYQSTLVVNDISMNPDYGGTRPPIFRPHIGSVRYVDCNTLIYNRRPSSTQLKQVSLQVVNPGGKQSPVYYVTIP